MAFDNPRPDRAEFVDRRDHENYEGAAGLSLRCGGRRQQTPDLFQVPTEPSMASRSRSA